MDEPEKEKKAKREDRNKQIWMKYTAKEGKKKKKKKKKKKNR